MKGGSSHRTSCGQATKHEHFPLKHDHACPRSGGGHNPLLLLKNLARRHRPPRLGSQARTEERQEAYSYHQGASGHVRTKEKMLRVEILNLASTFDGATCGNPDSHQSG